MDDKSINPDHGLPSTGEKQATKPRPRIVVLPAKAAEPVAERRSGPKVEEAGQPTPMAAKPTKPRPRIVVLPVTVQEQEAARLPATQRDREQTARSVNEEVPNLPQAVAGRPWTIPPLGLALGYVPPGSFPMGSDHGSNDEGPVRTVQITRGFWLAKYPTRQLDYRNLMGRNPSRHGGLRNPVDTVSWDDAMRFCARLNEREQWADRLPEGYEYRLPTEAEWEYAARGGPGSAGYLYAGSSHADAVAWHIGNSEGRSHAVGQKQANELGLHDMSGNVWEWCLDWYHAEAYASLPETDPVSLPESASRVIRGGSWLVPPRAARLAGRNGSWPYNPDSDTGFRVCLAPTIPWTAADE